MADARLSTDDLFKLLAEVISGLPVEESTLSDTPAVRAKRTQLRRDSTEMVAKGVAPDVPHEWA